MARKPTAPGSIPNYISNGLPKQDDDTLRDVIAYAEALIEHRASAEPEIPEDAEIVEEDNDSKGGTIVKEKVKCGKDSCKCNKGQLHGPYLYRYWSESGTTKSEYVGKPN